MIAHIENGEASIIVAISTEGRKKAAEIMGTVSLGNKSIKGVAQVREANKDKPPLQKFMEQTPKLILGQYDIEKSELVDRHDLWVWIKEGDIGITVDGSYTRGNISKKEGKKVAIRALRIVQSEVAKMPDGILLTNTPVSRDGLGKERASLYEAAGFGAPDRNSKGKMMSVVKNGKMTPISVEQYRYLMNNGHYNHR